MWLFGIAVGLLIGGGLAMLLRLLGRDFPFLLWQAMDQKEKQPDAAQQAYKAGAS